MEHEHTHTHAHSHDGVEHTHSHSHPHIHNHDHHEHDHDHEHHHHHHEEGAATDPQKILAVLQYMLDHNQHHCAELRDFCGVLSGEAQHQLLHAVEDFESANAHLAKVVAELQK